MRFCVGEEPDCNGPDCGHADDCPYYFESMKEDSSLRDELERWRRTTNGQKRRRRKEAKSEP